MVSKNFSISTCMTILSQDINKKPMLSLIHIQVTHSPMTVNHNTKATFHEDGKVQTFKFYTQKLREDMTVYISVTANNHVMFIHFSTSFFLTYCLYAFNSLLVLRPPALIHLYNIIQTTCYS